GPVHEHRIVEHQQLRVEERRHLRAAPRDPRPDFDALLPRSLAAVREAVHFMIEPRRRNAISQHLRPLNQDDRAPRHDPGRYTDAAYTPHTFSPNPDFTSPTSASSASCSSVPSAL